VNDRAAGSLDRSFQEEGATVTDPLAKVLRSVCLIGQQKAE
jgi:hypothetical protein